MEIIEVFEDGYAICADSTREDIYLLVSELVGGQVPLVMGDPPYGKIVKAKWDQTTKSAEEFADWMVGWTRGWTRALLPGGAFYVWGGIGLVGFRPFLLYLPKVESPEFQLANLITWSKKRAYGVQNNYLFTREELAYFVNGDAKRPLTFNVPYLDTKRGYAGYNAKYPAKSEYFRRTNVWTNITEILRGKRHDTQKAPRCMEVPIEVHTNPGEWVIDIFAGAGTTAQAARKLGRRFVVIEKDPDIFADLVKELRGEAPPTIPEPDPEELEQSLFDQIMSLGEE